MIRTAHIALISLLIALFTSCKHSPFMTGDVADVIPGNNTNGNNSNNATTGITCNPDTVYFNNTILPLFISNCAKSGCHDATSAAEGIILDSYSNIMNTGDIQPFNPNAGDIVKVISTANQNKIMPAPPNQPLTQQQVNQITQWINQGAQNNYCDACDTTNVTYSGKVKPILDAQCVGCHNNSTSGGSVNLSSYAGVQTVALNGHLMGSINHTPGYSFMPKNSNQLPQCQIDAIRIWIDNGALNN